MFIDVGYASQLIAHIDVAKYGIGKIDSSKKCTKSSKILYSSISSHFDYVGTIYTSHIFICMEKECRGLERQWQLHGKTFSLEITVLKIVFVFAALSTAFYGTSACLSELRTRQNPIFYFARACGSVAIYIVCQVYLCLRRAMNSSIL